MTDQIRISNSKANTWRRCPRSYYYKYVLKQRKKLRGLPLARGDWLHQLLMTHYDGEDWRERHKVLTAEFEKLFEEEREEYGDLPGECARIIRSYLAHWKEENTQEVVVDTEIDELVELPNGDTFNLIIDAIFERKHGGGLFIRDYKTVGRFMSSEYSLVDTQLARYFWGAKKLGYKINGAQFDELITKGPTIPKFLEKSNRLEKRKNIHCDAYTYYAEIKRIGQDPKDYREFLQFLKSRHEEWFRRTLLPRDAPMVKQTMQELMWTADEIKQATETNRFPRTVIKGNCEFQCDYFEPCIIELQGGDPEDVFHMKYEISKRPEAADEVEKQWVKTNGG